MVYAQDRVIGGGTVKYYIAKSFDGFSWKFGLSLLLSAITWIEGFYGAILWVFIGMFALDLLSGILRSRHQGIPISSHRLRYSVTKLGAYMILITALLFASSIETSFVPIVTVVYYYCIFTEFKSIVENVSAMGVKVPALLSGKIDYKIKENDTGDKDKKGE